MPDDSVEITVSLGSVNQDPNQIVDVTPGEDREFTIAVRYTGDYLRELLVDVQGLNPDWYGLSTKSVTAGDRLSETLKVSLPKTSDAVLGEYPFKIRVLRRTPVADAPQLLAEYPMQIRVRPSPKEDTIRPYPRPPPTVAR